MIVTAWKNGKHSETSTAYGLQLSVSDRDIFIHRDSESVWLELESSPNPIEVNVAKESFWGKKCIELIKIEIKEWLWGKGLAPWPNGQPPKLSMEPIGDNRFFVRSHNEREIL